MQDLEHKRIEYKDATLEMYGFPVAYFPFFFNADPSVKRESGLLPPVFGSSARSFVTASAGMKASLRGVGRGG